VQAQNIVVVPVEGLRAGIALALDRVEHASSAPWPETTRAS
jgi:hypothetical protein